MTNLGARKFNALEQMWDRYTKEGVVRRVRTRDELRFLTKHQIKFHAKSFSGHRDGNVLSTAIVGGCIMLVGPEDDCIPKP